MKEQNHDGNFGLCLYAIEYVVKLYFGNDFLDGNVSRTLRKRNAFFSFFLSFLPWHLLHILFSHLAADVCLCGILAILMHVHSVEKFLNTNTMCNWLSNKGDRIRKLVADRFKNIRQLCINFYIELILFYMIFSRFSTGHTLVTIDFAVVP